MIKVEHSNDARILNNAVLLSINDHEIDDILEYQFYNDITKPRKILIQDNGVKKEIVFKSHEQIKVKFQEPEYRHCENNCDFCFINGLPRGLRKELYFRDDDYRLSFLFGNFLSLTNVDQDDIKRIARLKLSPLYVSVHTTDPELRRTLFENEKAGLIMEQLSSLIDNNIKIHCQIVVIPGLTDGVNLTRSINDLSTLVPGVNSIGIVPVGKTKYINSIPLVSKKLARPIIDLADEFHNRFRKRYKRSIVYCADELYIKAGLSLPGMYYYDDFPQYENGIGMVRTFINEIENLNRVKNLPGRILFLTGHLARPFVNMLKNKFETNIDIIGIDNHFLGDSVTVSGLIAGEDFMRTINELDKKYDVIVLPPNCVNDSGEFIDGQMISRDCHARHFFWRARNDKKRYFIRNSNNNRVLTSPNNLKELIACLQ
jgi:putative radical SAM enzyme (TIGR03279 family)